MSSVNYTLSRKRLRSPNFRDTDIDNEPPIKLRKRYDFSFLFSFLLVIPLAITNKFKDLLSWVSDLNVSEFFAMAIRDGSKLPHETIILDDDDEDEDQEDDEDEIQVVKSSGNLSKLAPYIQRLENERKSGNNCRQSQRLIEKNGACSLISDSRYDSHRMTNGAASYNWEAKSRGNGSYNLRQSQTDNLKRPAVVSNPDTDIEILLGASSEEASAPEADEIEILSESPSTKQKSLGSQKSQRLCARSSVARNSCTSVSQLQSCRKVAAVRPRSVPYTANEVVRLQEKAQYKLLLEKYMSGSISHHVSKRSQSDAEVQADSSMFSGSHFQKEVIHQPIDKFIEKYIKPCQLLTPEKAKALTEKKEPTETKMDVDDSENDDDIQILDVKLPEYKPKYRVSCGKFLTEEWFSEFKHTVSLQTKERQKINKLYEKDLERYRKERLLNRLRVDSSSSQAVEPEFPELTPEMEEAVDKAWNTGAPDDRLCKITSDYLLRKDIETLSGLNWLNDLVINSYFDLIVERSKQEGYPSIHAYNTFFYSTYKTKGYASVRRWTRKIDIFSFDLNFVPIHLGVHWCLAVIDHRSKRVCYYDSMGSGEEQCLDLLHEYLCLEYKDKKGQYLHPSTYTTEIMKDIPQQMNGSDCGMFTLKYAEYISRDAEITFNQGHMQYFRRRMVYELLTSQLL